MRIHILLLAMSLVFFVCGVAPADISDGLVAHYPLDGDVTDASGNGNHGIMIGGSFTTDRFGNPDGALYLNGSGDHVNIGNNVKPALPLTMAGWVLRETLGRNCIIRNDVSNDGAYRHGAAVKMSIDGTLRGYLFEGFAAPDNRSGKYSVDSLAVTGQWHHFAVVFRGVQDIVLYWDGEEVAGDYYGTGSSMTYSGADGALGHHILNSVPDTPYLHGCLDDIRVYDRELSPAEVESLMCPAGRADLSVAATAQTSMAGMSSEWSTGFLVRNHGPDDASGAALDYTLPPWAQITSATPSQGTCDVLMNTVECQFGDIAAGDSATVDVTAYVDWTQVEHDVSVSSPHDMEDPANNTASGYATASCPDARSDTGAWERAAAAFTTQVHPFGRDLSDGLVAHYPFAGSWDDASGNGNDGTPYGGASLTDDRFGVPDDACLLNGADGFVDIGYGVKPDLPATVCAWFRNGSSSTDGTLLTTDNFTATQGHGLRVDVSGGIWALAFIYTGSTSPALYQWARVDYEPGDWHHLAVIFYSDDDADFYWDGVEITSGISGAATAPVYSGRRGSIGRDAVGGASYFDGDLDDVRVYSRALSPGEIQSLADPAADLTVSVVAPVEPIELGEDVTYEVTVTNVGDGDASLASLEASFGPEQIGIVSASPSQGTCVVDGSGVTCDLGFIPVSGQATVDVVTNLALLDVEGAVSVRSQKCDVIPANGALLTNVLVVCDGTSVPGDDDVASVAIDRARPNPFGAQTSLAFSLTEPQRVTVAVYDIAGRVVSRLSDEEYPAGPHLVAWDGTNDSGVRVASGVYFFVIRAGGAEKQQKMVFIK